MIRTFHLFFLVSFLIAGASTSARCGTIEGRVHFKGNRPPPVKISMTADRNCMKIHGGKDVWSDQVVINENNTLKNVFIYLKSGLPVRKYETPKKPARLEQTGCMYAPRVFGVMVNQPIEIINNDGTFHNVHALPKESDQFNLAQPKKGMRRTKSFPKPEVMVKFKCDVHNWMASYAGVMEHPFFAVSDDSGSFTIPDLPAGEYEFEAWHEKYGTRTMKVKVGAEDLKKIEFTYEVD